MKVEIKRIYKVNQCSQCPHMRTYIDSSVCEDCFDEPNYEWYCNHNDIDKNTNGYKKGYGKLIDVGMSQFQKCDIIPDWCPEKKEEEKPKPTTFGSAWEL